MNKPHSPKKKRKVKVVKVAQVDPDTQHIELEVTDAPLPPAEVPPAEPIDIDDGELDGFGHDALSGVDAIAERTSIVEPEALPHRWLHWLRSLW